MQSGQFFFDTLKLLKELKAAIKCFFIGEYLTLTGSF